VTHIPVGTKILIVEARFYAGISDALLAGATAALKAASVDFDSVVVPGALEIPGAIAMANASAHAAGRNYDGYVALGCVIRGETTHYETVANESARGLMDLAVHQRLAIGNGILTVENEDQAWARTDANRVEDKGGAAAKAVLAMVALRRQLGLGPK
jgi:6,7-dimethyl-8-ribityllumazine synthase